MEKIHYKSHLRYISNEAGGEWYCTELELLWLCSLRQETAQNNRKRLRAYVTTSGITGKRHFWDLKTHSTSNIASWCDDRRVLQRAQVGFTSKSLVKSSTKNHLKDATDSPVNPTKYPRVRTAGPQKELHYKQSFLLSPNTSRKELLIKKRQGRTASTPCSYHGQTHVPARSPPHFSL